MVRHVAARCAKLILTGAVLLGAADPGVAAAAAAPLRTDYCRPPATALSGPALARLLLKAPLRLAARKDRPGLSPSCLGPTRMLVDGPDIWGLIDSTMIVRSRVRDGTSVTIVPVVSGGSGQIFRTLLFTGPRGTERYVATLRGVEPSHLRVTVENGYVVERSPQDSTATCCWKHDYVRRSVIAHGRLRVVDVAIRPIAPAR
jgi:hypothetical protein